LPSTPFTSEAQILCRYAVTTMGKKKVAIAYQNDDYGKNGVAGAEKELAKHGLQLVAQVPVETADTDMKPHVMQFRKAEADLVLLWVGPTHAVRIVGTAAAMQYQPQWMSTSTCSDFPFMYGDQQGLWKGVIAATFGELPDSTSPSCRSTRKAFEKYAAKDERWGLFFYAGIRFRGAHGGRPQAKRQGPDPGALCPGMEGLRNFKGILRPHRLCAL
jgi:branched-chain amino acid transport system substrate-binding protein